jgi:hypothetical protein
VSGALATEATRPIDARARWNLAAMLFAGIAAVLQLVALGCLLQAQRGGPLPHGWPEPVFRVSTEAAPLFTVAALLCFVLGRARSRVTRGVAVLVAFALGAGAWRVVTWTVLWLGDDLGRPPA